MADLIGPDGASFLSLQIAPKLLPTRHLLIAALLLLQHRSKTTIVAFSNEGDQELCHLVDGVAQGSKPLDGKISTFKVV